MVGKIRCDTADQNAALLPSSKVSISRKPVVGSMKCVTAILPDTGVQPNCTENSRINNKPHQKIGIE